MKHLSKEQMMYLHSMAIKKTGGLDGIRDEGFLNSAYKVFDANTNIIKINLAANHFNKY